MSTNETDFITVELPAVEKSDFQLFFPGKAIGPEVRKLILAYLSERKDDLEKLKCELSITPEPIPDPSPSVRKTPGL